MDAFIHLTNPLISGLPAKICQQLTIGSKCLIYLQLTENDLRDLNVRVRI